MGRGTPARDGAGPRGAQAPEQRRPRGMPCAPSPSPHRKIELQQLKLAQWDQRVAQAFNELTREELKEEACTLALTLARALALTLAPTLALALALTLTPRPAPSPTLDP